MTNVDHGHYPEPLADALTGPGRHAAAVADSDDLFVAVAGPDKTAGEWTGSDSLAAETDHDNLAAVDLGNQAAAVIENGHDILVAVSLDTQDLIELEHCLGDHIVAVTEAVADLDRQSDTAPEVENLAVAAAKHLVVHPEGPAHVKNAAEVYSLIDSLAAADSD